MDTNRSIPQTAMLGPLRVPAAILLLWGALYTLVSNAYGGGFPHMPMLWWLLRFAQLALVVLLLVGKRNLGIMVPMALQLLLTILGLASSFSMGGLLSAAVWAVLCLVAAAVVIPGFGLGKSLIMGLAYLSAGLSLARAAFYLIPNLASELFLSGALYMYNVNDWLWALGILFLAKTLADAVPEPVAAPVQAGAPAYRTYSQPVYSQQPASAPIPASAPAPAAAVQSAAPGTLLVRFSIDRLNELSGPYGFQSGRLIGRAVPASLLEGMTISDGDSAATLAGHEYVCVVSIASIDSSVLKERIEPLILASSEIRACAAAPLTQLVDSLTTSEPLVVDGVVRNGAIEGRGGWCANGLASAWKEAAAQRQPPAPKAEKADKKELYLQKCVERLVALYRQAPDGFMRDQAVDVRAIGMLLDETGGMDLMRRAHGLFAQQNPGMARNLEIVWDGIGGWRG